MRATRMLIPVVLVVLVAAVTALVTCCTSPQRASEGPQTGAHLSRGVAVGVSSEGTVNVVDFTNEKDVAAGDAFRQWIAEHGWDAMLGDPVYFSIRDGALNMTAKAGPVFRKRAWYAVFNRDKLRHGIENQVLLNITPADFSVDLDRYPIIAFQMEPVTLPGGGADMRDPDKNDTAFCLLVSFDTQLHEYEGTMFRENIGYVWANVEWDKPVGTDPDYAPFIRYIPIGYGEKGLNQPHEVRRNVERDWRLAYPEYGDKPAPKIVRIALMIDSNSVDGVSESRLAWVRFEQEEQGQTAP